MSKFIGMAQKSGDYKLEDANTKEIREGTYHNFYMHYVDEADTSGANLIDSTAYESCIAKIKAENVSGVFGFDVTSSKQFKDWFMKDIEVLYNKKRNVLSVRLIEDPAKKSSKGD